MKNKLLRNPANGRAPVYSGMGWRADHADIRDFALGLTPGKRDRGPREANLMAKLEKLGLTDPAKPVPPRVDLRRWCTPVDDQGDLGSCTANAAVGMLEYCEQRTLNKFTDASRLFLYKATRDLLQWTGDSGAYLRSTVGAMALFGVPPEDYWPYDISQFDEEPSAFCYSFAQYYQAVDYYRLDEPSAPPETVLHRIKSHLAIGIPVVFGFTVYTCIGQADYPQTPGQIPFPVLGDGVDGGHAMLIVGYDDNFEITNLTVPGLTTKGALLVRNSWGFNWGEQGYGWLPYEYVQKELAQDFWVLLASKWIDTGRFTSES